MSTAPRGAGGHESVKKNGVFATKNIFSSGSASKFIHFLACDLAAPVAGYSLLTGQTIGVGVGAGGGVIVGFAASVCIQVVADPERNVGIAFTGTGAGPLAVSGFGANAGGQLSIPTAKTIYDLRGDALDANASFGPVGLDLLLEDLFVVACEASFDA